MNKPQHVKTSNDVETQKWERLFGDLRSIQVLDWGEALFSFARLIISIPKEIHYFYL